MGAVKVRREFLSISVSAALLLLLTGAHAVFAAERAITRIEVRFVAATGGETFATSRGEKIQLEPDPVLLTRHFSGVAKGAESAKGETRAKGKAPAKKRRSNPNAFGTVDIELLYEASGRMRFDTAARLADGRRYCLLIDDTVENCASFPADGPTDEDKGQIIPSVPETEARRLTGRLTAAIRKAASSLKSAERSVPAGSPKTLVDKLYRGAMKSAGPDWLDGDRRGAYLASSLLELWDAVDVVQAAGNRDAPLDADPLAASASLTLKSFRIGKLEQPDRQTATVPVVLDYQEPAYPKPVVFTLVKERGRWRISDIEYNSTTLSQQLRIYLSAALPKEARR